VRPETPKYGCLLLRPRLRDRGAPFLETWADAASSGNSSSEAGRNRDMANKLCTLLSRGELRDLVDVMALEQAGHRVEEHLEFAARKDAGLTPAQLAWVLSQLEIGEDASPPGGVSADELRGYLDELVRRLSEVAYPE